MQSVTRLFKVGSLVALAITMTGSVVLAQAAKQAAPSPASGQSAQATSIKQIALAEKQIEGVLAAQKEIDAITDKMSDSTDAAPDPKMQAQLDGVAKKYGFSGFADYSNVVDNIDLVMSGIDPQTKTFLQPPEALKKQIAAIAADTKMPAKDKKAALEEMNAALKTTPNIQFQDNVALVVKNYDKLAAALQDDQQ
jgi:hypothetical protein